MGGGLQDFSVIPRPLGFGFLGLGLRGLGPGLDNYLHLTIYIKSAAKFSWFNSGFTLRRISRTCRTPGHCLYSGIGKM